MTRRGKAEAARQVTHAVRDLLLTYKAAMEEALRGYGLTLPQLRLLHAVKEKTEVSSAAIARECHVTPQTLQAMMARAVREGWIVRERSEHNQRILIASLTPKGKKLLDRGDHFAMKIEEQMWKNVSMQTLDNVFAALKRGTSNVVALEPPLK